MGRRKNNAQRLEVVSLYVEEGLNCAQIGRVLGISRQAVRQMLIRCNIDIRPRGSER